MKKTLFSVLLIFSLFIPGCASAEEEHEPSRSDQMAIVCSDSNMIAYITEDKRLFYINRDTETESKAEYIPGAVDVIKVFGSDQKIVYLDETGSITTFYLQSGETEKMTGVYDDLYYNGLDFLAAKNGDSWEIIESRYADLELESVVQIGGFFGGAPKAALFEDGTVKALELDVSISPFQKGKIDGWDGITQIACTMYNVYALGKDRKVYCDMGDKWNSGDEKNVKVLYSWIHLLGRWWGSIRMEKL